MTKRDKPLVELHETCGGSELISYETLDRVWISEWIESVIDLMLANRRAMEIEQELYSD